MSNNENKPDVYLHLSRITDYNVECLVSGGDSEIATMLLQAMLGSNYIAAIVLGAIPSFLDESGRDRAGYCEVIMNAAGQKNKKG